MQDLHAPDGYGRAVRLPYMDEAGDPQQDVTLLEAFDSVARILEEEYGIKFTVKSASLRHRHLLKDLQGKYREFSHHVVAVGDLHWPPTLTPDGKAILVDGHLHEDSMCVLFDTAASGAIAAGILREHGFVTCWWPDGSGPYCGHQLTLFPMLTRALDADPSAHRGRRTKPAELVSVQEPLR